jgi:hypothetical protein
MSAFDLLLGVLATWRLSALLCYDYSMEWLRQLAKVDFVDDQDVSITYAGRILSCFWCTSLFVGIQVVVLLIFKLHWTLLPFALSGGSIILNHWTRIVRDVQRE